MPIHSNHSNSPIEISYQKIIYLAIPVLLANLAIPLQSAIDTAIVGHLHSPSMLAGLGLSTQVLSIVLVSFNFLQYSSSGLSAQATGQANFLEVFNILKRAILLAIIIGGILVVLQTPLIDVSLQLLSANQDSHLSATTYLQIRFFGIIAELMNFAFIGWFAGQGKTQLMLYQQSFIAISNIILTLIFVYIFNLGLVGVALGTVIAFWLGIIFACGLVFNWLKQHTQELMALPKSPTNHHKQPLTHEIFKLKNTHIPKQSDKIAVSWFIWLINNLRPSSFKWHDMLRLFSLNKDIFIRTTILTLSLAWITRLSAQSGDLVLASNAILLQILSISSFALDGVAVSAETLSGQTAGQKNWQAFRQVVKKTGLVSYALAIIMTLLWWLALPYYLEFMTNIASVHKLAYDYHHYAILLPIIGVGAYWLDGIFFGLTAGKTIRNTAICLAMVFFPLSWFLYQKFTLTGIWLSIWALLLLRLAFLAIFLWQFLTKSVKNT